MSSLRLDEIFSEPFLDSLRLQLTGIDIYRLSLVCKRFQWAFKTPLDDLFTTYKSLMLFIPGTLAHAIEFYAGNLIAELAKFNQKMGWDVAGLFRAQKFDDQQYQLLLRVSYMLQGLSKDDREFLRTHMSAVDLAFFLAAPSSLQALLDVGCPFTWTLGPEKMLSAAAAWLGFLRDVHRPSDSSELVRTIGISLPYYSAREESVVSSLYFTHELRHLWRNLDKENTTTAGPCHHPPTSLDRKQFKIRLDQHGPYKNVDIYDWLEWKRKIAYGCMKCGCFMMQDYCNCTSVCLECASICIACEDLLCDRCSKYNHDEYPTLY